MSPRVLDLVTPEGVRLRFAIAPLSARLAAQILDLVVTVAGGAALILGLWGVGLISAAVAWFLAPLVFFGLRIPYYVLAEMLANGQTIGKRWMGIRVIAARGGALEPHAVTVRNLMREAEIFAPGTALAAVGMLEDWAAALVLAWVAVVVAVPLASRHGQRLGDILADTVVIALPQPVLRRDMAAGAAAAFSFRPDQLAHYGRHEVQTLERLLQVPKGRPGTPLAERHRARLSRVAETIAIRIAADPALARSDPDRFLRDFYRAQRGFLEHRRLFGERREDKHAIAAGSGQSGAAKGQSESDAEGRP